MRLDKFLCDCGFGTRKEVRELIKKGGVQVCGAGEGQPGKAASDPGMQIDPKKVQVSVNGERIRYREHLYLLLHKPAGVVTATSDKRERTVMEFVPPEAARRVQPVGRLDKDTEGLLLLTDDGELSHRLLSPKRHVEKLYEAHLSKDLTREALERLESGVDIGDGEPTLPAKAEMGPADAQGRPVLYLTLHEGRFHQVKRMAEAVGSEVLYLKRLRMGPLSLPEDLAPGACRELTPEEEDALRSAAGLREGE
ncbi:MAG: rRNA pseudouridine synthase [Lachnospiraceae bacterium]|nr:rRNA pseudouridine synthase [Lachnospiraceae bacterium]